MKDFFGNTLAIGDVVAFYNPGYRYFVTGTVIKFTPQQVKVAYKSNFKPDDTYMAYPDMFIKKPIDTATPTL